MSVEENKAKVRQWTEGLNSQEWAAKLRPAFTTEADWEDFRQEHATFRRAFPDYHNQIDGIIGEGDYIVVWSTISGTFSQSYELGGLAGLEPKGQKAVWREVSVIDFSGEQPNALLMVDELDRRRQLE